MARLTLLLVGFLSLAACDSTASPDYDDLSGTHTGTVHGSASGYSLTGAATLSVSEQKDGDISGSLTLNAKLEFGLNEIPVSGTQAFTGTVSEGRNPSVTVSVTNQRCGSVWKQTGTHRTEAGSTVLTGQMTITGTACDPLLTLSVTTSLTG